MRKVCLILFLGIGILALWIFFPIIFKYWVLHVLVTPPFTTEVFASLGPIGDIFGGLTALFTSATLLIVIYSAYLQRQANEDARKAMAEQLNETRRASSEQIAQARESTRQQLLLAQATHDAQIIESRNAIFTNQFYSLLNYKKDLLNSIILRKKLKVQGLEKDSEEVSCIYAIEELSRKFHNFMPDYKYSYIDFNQADFIRDFYAVSHQLGYESINTLISYFHSYVDLCKLIKKPELSEADREFFKSVLSNSMFQGEQIVLFWITPMFSIFNFEDTEIFSKFGYVDAYVPFAKKFHKITHFRNLEWKNVFLESE